MLHRAQIGLDADDHHHHRVERKQWQSLAELAQAAQFERAVEEDHPRAAALLKSSGMDRRTFLKLMGATMALAGATSCTARPPEEPILPYVTRPEEVALGRPLFFATTMTQGGYALGALIETHEGRPTQLAGNPHHPASLGGANPFLLAEILELYNPDRSTEVRQAGAVRTWDDFLAALETALGGIGDGAGLRILTETVTSPTLASQLQRLLDQYPAARWVQYEPLARDNVVAGAKLAFGEAVETVYRFDQADVVLALDADFFTALPGSLRYVRDFMDRRRVRADGEAVTMNRLYAVESTPTITGAMADHRLPLRPSQIEYFVRALAQRVGVAVDGGGQPAWDAAWFDAMLADLQAAGANSLVVAGDEQSPAVHALVHAINAALGNIGSTVVYLPPVAANPLVQIDDLRTLVEEMASGAVQMLVILGGNPVYTAPADLAFADALAQVLLSVHLSRYHDETSARCTWRLPQTHFIEEWSDARAFDGTASLTQPPIGPLYPTVRSAHEVLALLLGDARSGYDILRSYWESQYDAGDFEGFWRRSLHNGVVEESAFAPIQPVLRADFAAQLPASAVQEGLELLFRADPTVGDGRYAANSWLQELPKPLTKLTWDNAALVSPATAARLNLDNEDLVELSYQGRTVTTPIWIMPGHADEAVTVTLGYGRSAGGAVGQGAGFNAYALRTADAPWFGAGLQVRATGGRYRLAATQQHWRVETSEPVRLASLATFRAQPDFVDHGEHGLQFSLLPKANYEEHAWGMSIDLTACIGCNACVIACQSENTIPTVGKEQVLRAREMHWIRIDTYFEGDEANPATHFQPLACVHCETAPCEVVCPVQATVHSRDGLNQMVYNRCVGTRYCSANCPYSVRRFNYLDYHIDDDPILIEMRNPDVTVRSRGVMEKCTYCVQRISHARIDAKRANRPIADGEITPACAAACPTRAIVFGDINNPESEVAQLKAQPHNYGLLAELNTMPRTTYLARITNPNAELGIRNTELGGYAPLIARRNRESTNKA